MKIIIDREKWAALFNVSGITIKNCGQSLLLNSEDGMCCLGFVSVAKGVNKEFLEGEPYPRTLDTKIEGLSYIDQNGWLTDTEFTKMAAHINDSCDYESPSKKENALINLFKENGMELVFEGKYSERICGLFSEDPIIMAQTGRLIEN